MTEVSHCWTLWIALVSVTEDPIIGSFRPGYRAVDVFLLSWSQTGGCNHTFIRMHSPCQSQKSRHGTTQRI